MTASDGSFVMPATDVTMTGSWMPHTDTLYTVEYYQQNIDENAYMQADTAYCVGTTDAMAIAPEKAYTGFTITPASVTAASSANIDGTGTTALTLYYDRNVNAVTYAYTGETDTAPPTLPTSGTYRYGAEVVVDTGSPALSGYDFGGWEASDAVIAEGRFTMPDTPVELVGQWIACTDTPFTVEYHQQNVADDGYTLTETFNGTGTTGVNISHRVFEGVTQTPDSVTAGGTQK